MDLDQVKAGLKWLAAGAGPLIPAMAYYTNHAPPLFSGVASLVAALGGALVIAAAASSASGTQAAVRSRTRKGLLFIATALVLLTVYSIGLQFTTVLDPSGINRFQVGFGLSNWSLTSAGRAWIDVRPGITASEMILFEAAFNQETLPRLWKSWSIYLAGGAMIFVYLSAFSAWTFGFALLARHQKPFSTNGTKAGEHSAKDVRRSKGRKAGS